MACNRRVLIGSGSILLALFLPLACLCGCKSSVKEHVPQSHDDPGDAELIFRSGNTIADRFNIKMTPGDYYVIFDYGPAAVATTDHFGGGVSGAVYRRARSQIMPNYALPCEDCP